MAAGLGFKTFTTGEVLTAGDVNGYLMQGINVFASSAARASAITSPQEGQYSFLKDTNALEYYDGAAWVGAPVGDITAVTAGTGISGGGSSGDVTITNSMATTITTKGDLVPGTGSATFARLAAGANDTVLTADSSTATGLKWAAPASSGSTYVAGKNFLINGGMDIWQRGTSISPAAYAPTYTADRWQVYTGYTQTITQETTTIPTGARYALKYTSTVSAGTCSTYQYVETSNTTPLVGKTVIVSAQVTGTTGKTPYVQIEYSTTVDAGYAASWTTLNTGSTVSVTAGTFSTVTATGTIPSTAKTVRIMLGAAVLNNAEYLIWGNVQLEIASTATPFSRAAGTLALELAACQRYYSRVQAVTTGEYFGQGPNNNTAGGLMYVTYPVRMRVAPTSLDYSLLFLQQYDNAGNYRTANVTSISFSNVGTQSANCNSTTASTSFTTGNMQLLSQAGLGYLGFNAEL